MLKELPDQDNHCCDCLTSAKWDIESEWHVAHFSPCGKVRQEVCYHYSLDSWHLYCLSIDFESIKNHYLQSSKFLSVWPDIPLSSLISLDGPIWFTYDYLTITHICATTLSWYVQWNACKQTLCPSWRTDFVAVSFVYPLQWVLQTLAYWLKGSSSNSLHVPFGNSFIISSIAHVYSKMHSSRAISLYWTIATYSRF